MDMKKTIIAGAFALMGILLFSCAKEMNVESSEENPAVSGKTVTITATATVAETKTTYVDNEGTIEVNWESTESFKAYTSSSRTGDALTFTKTDAATGQSATFQTTDEVSDGTTLYAVYDPQGKFTSGTTIDLTDAYVTDVNNLKDYDVMFAEGTVSGTTVNFAFTHALSFFKVTLNRGSLTAAGNDNDLKLTLVFNNCKKVGDYNYNGCEFSGNVLTRTITLAAGDVPAAGASTTIYVAMPPLEYVAAGSPVSSGLTASYSKIFSLKSGKSIDAGTVYSTTVPFAPNNLQAVFGTPGGNATYTSTYSWTSSTNNLMTLYTFASGELANYDKLTFTVSSLSAGANFRINLLFSDSSDKSSLFYNDNSPKEKTITELLGDSGKSASDVTAIRFGGNSSSGSCIIDLSSVSLTGTGVDPLLVTKDSFKSPKEMSSSANATYAPYTWTGSTNNLMNCFTFTKEELAAYATLNFTFTGLSEGASVRINVLYDDDVNNSKQYANAGSKSTSISELLSGSYKAKNIKAIRFGGYSSTGDCYIVPVQMYLTK